MPRLQFCVEHGRGRNLSGSGGELINMLAEKAPTGAKSTVNLTATPGTALFTQLGVTEPVTAVVKAWGRLVAITETAVYIIAPDGTWQNVGAGMPGRVSAATNGTVVVAVNGTSGIVITQTGVSTISDPDFHPASTVQFIGGYFVFERRTTGEYFISDLYSTDFDALDFQTAESAPDDLLAVVAVRREIWLLGTDTVEVHSLTGASFPFTPITGVAINYGCGAKFSAIAVGSDVVWLSDHGVVMQSVGYQARRISTHEIEEEIEELAASWDDAFAWTYIERGHQFYVLTIGTKTFAFDFATQLWHRRSTISTTAHLALSAERAFNKTLVGDSNGRILHLSKDYYQDAGEDIVAVIGSIPFHADNQQFGIASLTFDGEVGYGGRATLEHSADDGKSWSSRIEASMGAIGQHDFRPTWRQLGTAFQKRMRLRLYGDVPKRISSTAVVEIG